MRREKKNALITFIPPKTFRTATEGSTGPVHPSRAYLVWPLLRWMRWASCFQTGNPEVRGCRKGWDSKIIFRRWHSCYARILVRCKKLCSSWVIRVKVVLIKTLSCNLLTGTFIQKEFFVSSDQPCCAHQLLDCVHKEYFNLKRFFFIFYFFGGYGQHWAV